MKNEIALQQEIQRLTRENQKLDAAQREVATLKAKAAGLSKERDKLLQQLNVIESIETAGTVQRPEWILPKKKKGVDYHATLTLHITDTHFDEIVDPHQIDGINAYNREIAELRLRRCLEKVIWLARHYLNGVTYDGIAVLLGGDIFSG